MSRRLFAPAVTLLFVVSSSAAFAQSGKPAAQPAAPTAAPAPPAKAVWVKPVKGTATIDVIQSPARKVGNDIVTVMKIKNTSGGAIALLKGEEFWYDKNLKLVTGDTMAPLKKPINPGEIVEITFKSPYKPDLYRSNYAFTHANGEVKANAVKAFK